MFSSLIARLNSLSVLNDAMSRFSSGANYSFTVCALELFPSTSCPVPPWACLTRMFSDSFQGFPDLSEEPSSSCKPFSLISWERDVSPLTTNTSSVLSGFHDRSQIGLGFGWVSWENIACWTSPEDCWTSLPTGCCSTVEPNLSFPLVPSWSCRNEIFGWWSRRHVWFLIQNFSSLQSHNFWNTISWKWSLKDNCIRSSLIECQSLSNRKINQSNIPRLDVSSMHSANIVLDAVQRRQYIQGLCDFYLLDQWARRILFVFYLNPDLQVLIHCWWLNKIKSTSDVVNV